MKLLLAGNGLLLAGTIADWHDLALTRWNQAYRTDTGDAVRYVADQIYNGSNSGSASGRWSGLSSLDFRVERELTRQERNELARDLRIIAGQIANNGAGEGACGGLHWRLELVSVAVAEPAAEPADDEAA